MRLIDLYNIIGLSQDILMSPFSSMFPVHRCVTEQQNMIYNKVSGFTDTEVVLKTKDLLKYNKEIPNEYTHTIQDDIYSIFNSLIIKRNSIMAKLMQTGKISHGRYGTITEYDCSVRARESYVEDILDITNHNNTPYVVISSNQDCAHIIRELHMKEFHVLTTKYFTGRTATFIPKINIGSLLVGITPGEAEMLNGIDYSEMSKDRSINITLTEHSDGVETKMEQLFLPSFKEDIVDKISIVRFQ